ncbi:MAG: uracil phosphoribosyltransferase [Pirellulales bacterium]
MSIHLLNHALAKHHITTLRDKKTSAEQFRKGIHRLTTLLVAEATKNLERDPYEVETPLALFHGEQITRSVGLVPILRAGLSMVDTALDLLPFAEVWHLGLYRDEATATPVEYYSKIPETDPIDVAIILDPMLATGGSASAVIDKVKGWGVQHVYLLSLIASQPGVDALYKSHPDVHCFICDVDSSLNDNKFIIPGLGDAGDRAFQTR